MIPSRAGSNLAAAFLCGLLLFPMRASASWFSDDVVDCAKTDRAIVIDGKDNDWVNIEPQEYENMAADCFSDGEDVYLYLTPRDHQTENQLIGKYGQTFTLWLDPSDKKREAFGLRFAYNPSNDPITSADLRNKPDIEPPDVSDALAAVSIVRSSADAGVPLSSSPGLEAALGNTWKGIFFEIKIPRTLLALSSSRRPKLGLGFETSALSPQARDALQQLMQEQKQRSASGGYGGSEDSSDSGGYGGGGFGSGGGGFGGGMGRHRGGGGGHRGGAQPPAMPAPFTLWMTAKLAKK